MHMGGSVAHPCDDFNIQILDVRSCRASRIAIDYVNGHLRVFMSGVTG